MMVVMVVVVDAVVVMVISKRRSGKLQCCKYVQFGKKAVHEECKGSAVVRQR